MSQKNSKVTRPSMIQITPKLEKTYFFDPTTEIEEGIYVGQILENCFRLTDRERFVIFSRMGFGECAGLTQRELAERLGVCAGRVGDMETDAVRKIKDWLYLQNRTEVD